MTKKAAAQEAPAAITLTQTAPTEPNPGVPDGTVWTDVHGRKVKVVYEYTDKDDPQKMTGWHVKPQGRAK